MRDDWLESGPQRCQELMQGVHDACDAVWNRPAVVSSPPVTDRATLLLWAADQIDVETRQAKADGVLEPDRYRPCRDASAQLRRLAAEAQPVPAPLRAELKPWQLLGDQPDEPLPQTERLRGGRRLTELAAGARKPDTETHTDEVALLRLTADAVEEGRRELRAENARLRSQLWTLAATFEGFGNLLATSSRDWGQYAPDAWLYAVICGWDCEQPEHDETCTHGAMEEMQQLHGWSDEAVAKARRYRAVVHMLTTLAVSGRPAADDTSEDADRVVAYRLGVALHCIGCTPSPRGDIWEPATSDDLPDGGVCAGCGVDVLIPREVRRG